MAAVSQDEGELVKVKVMMKKKENMMKVKVELTHNRNESEAAVALSSQKMRDAKTSDENGKPTFNELGINLSKEMVIE